MGPTERKAQFGTNGWYGQISRTILGGRGAFETKAQTSNDIFAKNVRYLVLAMQYIIVKIILYQGIYKSAFLIFYFCKE